MGIIGVLADRLVSFVLPKATAGACPCGDCVYSACGYGDPCTRVPGTWRMRTCYTCNCAVRSRTCVIC